MAAIVGWTALAVQLAVLIVNGQTNGMGTLGALSRFLAYFTILTNLGATISFTARSAAPDRTLGRWCARPIVATGLMVALSLVGLVYSLVLRALWSPTGVQKLADMLLHDVMPIVLLIDWLRHTPKGTLRWRDLPRWFVYPAAYFVYAMGRGAGSGFYPYPFLDLSQLTIAQVAVNTVVCLGVVAVLGAVALVIDARLARQAEA